MKYNKFMLVTCILTSITGIGFAGKRTPRKPYRPPKERTVMHEMKEYPKIKHARNSRDRNLEALQTPITPQILKLRDKQLQDMVDRQEKLLSMKFNITPGILELSDEQLEDLLERQEELLKC